MQLPNGAAAVEGLGAGGLLRLAVVNHGVGRKNPQLEEAVAVALRKRFALHYADLIALDSDPFRLRRNQRF
jgi:hypothetical protein